MSHTYIAHEARLHRLNLPTLNTEDYKEIWFTFLILYPGGIQLILQATVDFKWSNIANTRGNINKMQLTHMHYNLHKQFFSNRIIAVWNCLPNIIVNAESTNIFKNRLDRFWINEEIKFDWHADIAWIGSRNVNS